MSEHLARARTYGWIGEVLLDGWTERAVHIAGALDWLELPADAEQRAARHYRVFGQVPPYASAFVGREGLLGGPIAGEHRERLEPLGLPRTDVEPDHLGLTCQALAWLHTAAHEGHPADVEPFRGSLGWLRVFQRAVARQGIGELTALVELLVELVDPPAGSVQAEDPPEDLRDLARYWATPARCGVWLGLDDIRTLAGELELASGFGKRVKMLETLLATAIAHEKQQALTEALAARR